MPDTQTIPAQAGWYFVRVWDGPGHVNGLQRIPVAAWTALTEGGKGAWPLLAKPGTIGLALPDDDDKLAAVGLCPPDREWQTYFPDETVREAMFRWKTAGRGAGERAERAVLREVEMPGVGKVPVRDARPEAQRGTADWITRAWGGSPGQPKLGAGS